MKKNNLKKVFGIIFSNLLIFGIFVIGADYYIEYNMPAIDNFLSNKGFFQLNIDDPNLDEYEVEETTVKSIELNEENHYRFCGEDRTQIGTDKNYSKNPIVVLGCSYAYGHGLKKEETFPYLLSELTKRPILNFAACGEHIWFGIKKFDCPGGEFSLPDPDYVIYIYMHDHMNRYLSLENLYLFYDEVFPNKRHALIRIPLIKLLYCSYQLKNIKKDIQSVDTFLKNIILLQQKRLKEFAPHAEFIIILYDEKLPDFRGPYDIKFNSDRMKSKIWEELEQENGIKVVHTKDIVGFFFDKDYKLEEDIADWHPNAKAWALFTPLFAEKYIK